MGIKWADKCLPRDVAELPFSSEIEESDELVYNQQDYDDEEY